MPYGVFNVRTKTCVYVVCFALMPPVITAPNIVILAFSSSIVLHCKSRPHERKLKLVGVSANLLHNDKGMYKARTTYISIPPMLNFLTAFPSNAAIQFNGPMDMA